MPVFEYNATSSDGAAATGTIVADTPRQARDALRERGLKIAAVAPVAKARGRLFGASRQGRRDQHHVVKFVRELATLLQAGIPLLPALNTLARQHQRRFRAVVQQLADQVGAGASLADAMAVQEAYFDEMCVSIVRVGESTGLLESALSRLADFKEKAHALRSRVTTALIYPAVVCIVGLAVSIFLMTYVVPNLLGTLEQAGKELPAITRAVKGISDFLVGWWWLLGILGFGAVAAFSAAMRTARGRLAFDWLILRVPIIGELVRMETTSRMAVVLGSLLRSGLPFVEAIRITRRTVPNRVFQQAMVDYEAAVTAGRDVAGPLEASGVFSPMVVEIVSVGQQAGQLEEMLQQLSESYDREVAVATGRLTAVLEPVLIVILAIVVGFIAFATVLPILEVSNVL
ncbi:MAG: type II secretion system F family protein [Phycisphaerae bacterium]